MRGVTPWRRGWVALAARVRHNDFDAACRFWFGDRHPHEEADPTGRNRDFGGSPTPLAARRCLVCRPFSAAEADMLVER